MIWLCGEFSFEFPTSLETSSNSLFSSRKLKLKHHFKHILNKINEKYLYISFQINLKWAKIESKTTASILKIIIFKDFKLEKITKVLSQISIFSHYLWLKFLEQKLKMPHTGSIEDDIKLSKQTGPNKEHDVTQFLAWPGLWRLNSHKQK